MFRSIAATASPLVRSYATSKPLRTSSQVGTTFPLGLAGLLIGTVGTLFYVGDNFSYPLKPAHAEEKEEGSPFEGVRPSALTKDKFSEYTLSDVKEYNHNSHIYTFKFPDPNAISGGPITHLLMLRAVEDGLIVDAKGKDIARPYTPVSTPDTVGEISFLIKKYDTGKFTPYLASLKVGDKVAFKGPFAKFPYKPSVLEQGVAIAGGSGITPMYQLINHSLNSKDDSTKWTLIYSNVTEADILLRKEWDSLAASHPDRLKVVYALDKPPAGWTGSKGYITPELIKSAGITATGDKIKFFVCGPPGQVKAIAGDKDGGKQGPIGGTLAALGYEAGQVYKF
ncbi:hypothetical protein BDY24DRAFT_385536 [Mrakia frigida]|uniref:cytochrome b5 reductase family protein n=1 Tax=Mrakia frigida TaxID=29902 RepID=UPI003FCC11F2